MMRFRLPARESESPHPEDEVSALVGSLIAAGVEFSTEGGDVVYSGPARALPEDSLAALRAEKTAVLLLLERARARGVVRLGGTTWEQRRMEWRSRTDRNPATYNVCLRVDLRGAVHPCGLARVADALVARHEIFRTRFAWYGPHLLQEVMAQPRSVLQVLEPTALDGADEQQVSAWCARRGAAAFDLAAEAPARWCYASIGPRRALLLLTLHHIACDGWSIERLQDEALALGRAELGLDPDSALSPVAMSPCEFARWESSWLSEDRIASARSFWAEELRGALLAPTLTGARIDVAPGGDSGCVTRSISTSVSAGVIAAARSLAISEFSLYFAAFAMLLSEETDGRDCGVVIAVLNRTRPEHEEVMGLTRNAQPIRCSANVGEPIDIVARRISDRVERAVAYQWFPIGMIVPSVDEAVDARQLPITFAYSGTGDVALDCPELSATVHDVFLGAARAGFSLFVRRRGDRTEAFFEFSSTHLSSKDAARMAERYVAIITAEMKRWQPRSREIT